jgi:hypothetical protein
VSARAIRACLTALVLTLSQGHVLAAEPAWAKLAPQEKQILAPLRDSWDTLEERRKAKWREVARLYPGMSSEEQSRLQGQMRQWAALTPEQRRAAREEFREHTRLDPDRKQDVLEKWKTYSTLPPEQRKAIVGGDAPTSASGTAAANR